MQVSAKQSIAEAVERKCYLVEATAYRRSLPVTRKRQVSRAVISFEIQILRVRSMMRRIEYVLLHFLFARSMSG